jgi:hypothetical protein
MMRSDGTQSGRQPCCTLSVVNEGPEEVFTEADQGAG